MNRIRIIFFPKNICSICKSRIFYGDASNPEKYCTVCHSHERHRALTKKLKTLPIKGTTILEVAPLSPLIYACVLKQLGCRHYLSCDKWPEGNPHDPRNVTFADFFCDLVDLDKSVNEKFDYIILQHVIEEIEDYKKTLTFYP